MLIDANNVRRSQWPNLSDDELVRRTQEWAERHGHEADARDEEDESLALAGEEITSDEHPRGAI